MSNTTASIGERAEGRGERGEGKVATLQRPPTAAGGDSLS
jgi:hypothetical protein